jgi:hypothetical protein
MGRLEYLLLSTVARSFDINAPPSFRTDRRWVYAHRVKYDDAVSFGLGLGYCIWSGHSGSGCYLYDGMADQRTMATGHDTGL